ncbi:tyrosine-type recombinase/integrase [Vibrio sp. 10N.247.311.51]|uniref:tyrosine-type recombinase/integrase n=1 Tax=Vibrio sp. 10N.247.311.51 TaxID=3229996 RepID=UPI00354EFA7F
MRLGVAAGIIEFNPLSEITKLYPTQKVQHNPALLPEELPALVKTIRESNSKIITKNLILWQLHTMVRPGEAARARWSELDRDNLVWIVPSETMKMEREHVVPFTSQMLTILDLMEPLSGHVEFLFPVDRNPRHHSNTQTANMALKCMGFEGKQPLMNLDLLLVQP